jgi:membrane-bound ClpP family serine protease
MAGAVALAAGPAGAAGASGGAGAAGDRAAQAGCAESGTGPVAVVEVDGLLDPVLVDFIEDQVHADERACAVALVLQLDSGDAVVSDGELDHLIATIDDSSVPVNVWIGPSGSKAAGEAVRVVAAAEVTGIAPGSSIEVTPTLLDANGVAPGDLGTVDVGDRVGAGRAVELGFVDSAAPVIGQFVVDLPGVET